MKPFHPVAGIFPLMDAEAFSSLCSDIAANGLREPIWLHEGQVIDGRNRYRACVETGTPPAFRDYEGTADDLLGFVLSLNLERRHLTSSQRAVVALEVEAYFRKVNPPGRPSIKPANICAFNGENRELAAAKVGTNRQYVSDAKKIKADAPELLTLVSAGTLTIPDARKMASLPEPQRAAIRSRIEAGDSTKKAIRTARKEARAAGAVMPEAGTAPRDTVEPGSWWHLGAHLLYCGDTTAPDFIDGVRRVAPCSLAFADPPYGADAADWDSAFVWNHDYLSDLADVVCVTPGIVSIPTLFERTAMPYAWSVACWIKNGMTRGAMGFGNWIYAAVFSRGSVHRTAQDFVSVTVQTSETGDTSHKGRKPSEFVAYLVQTFTAPGDTVVDPFLGSGTTLLVSENMGRRCIGGDISPDFCAEIIARWESQTGRTATRRTDA